MSGKDLIAEKKQLLERLKTIPQDRAAIEEASSTRRLHNLIVEERQLLTRLQAVSAEEGRIFHRTEPTHRELEVVRLIADNQDRERQLFTDSAGSLVERFIRADSIDFHRQEHDDAQKRLEELNAKYAGATITMGGRVHAEAQQLEATIAAWESTMPLAIKGAKVWRLRADRKDLTEELESLREQRKQAAVAAVAAA